MPVVLFLSNGHGEDAAAAAIARELRAMAPQVELAAAPIVGDGLAFRRLPIPVVTPTRPMPSGGFLHLHRPGTLWRDLLSGLVRLHLSQALALRRLDPTVSLVVGVGDRLILYAARWLLRKPLLLVNIADSAYLTEGRVISNPAERRMMRRYARRVFTRDEQSARLLRQDGVPAEFVGNPMMDAVGGDALGGDGGEGSDAGTPPRRPTIIALLPGSREEAYVNLRLILEGVLTLAAGGLAFEFVTAWPDHLPLERLRSVVEGSRWELRLEPPARPAGAATDARPADVRGWLAHPRGTRVEVAVGRFGAVLRRAALVIGLAGTANEQAAGLGRPVITCPGVGPQMTKEMMRRQQLLLGEAVRAVEPTGRALAGAVLEIVRDGDLYRRMSQVGRARMGPPGGARRIAVVALAELARLQGTAPTAASP